jgi:hypothetical protein
MVSDPVLEAPAVTHDLTVSVGGTGSGTVTGTGIDCPGDCSETYEEGAVVTLTATPTGGSSFAGWGGDCASSAGTTCELTMSADRSASATFDPPTPPAPGPADLGISVTPKKRVAGVGELAQFTVTVQNTGGVAAQTVRVCAKKPGPIKRLGRACRKIGSLAAGASASRTFGFRPKKRAAGRKFRLRFRAKAAGLAAVRTSAFIKVPG